MLFVNSIRSDNGIEFVRKANFDFSQIKIYCLVKDLRIFGRLNEMKQLVYKKAINLFVLSIPNNL